MWLPEQLWRALRPESQRRSCSVRLRSASWSGERGAGAVQALHGPAPAGLDEDLGVLDGLRHAAAPQDDWRRVYSRCAFGAPAVVYCTEELVSGARHVRPQRRGLRCVGQSGSIRLMQYRDFGQESTSGPRRLASALCVFPCSPTTTASPSSSASTTRSPPRCCTGPSTPVSTTSTPRGCTTRTPARCGSVKRSKDGYRERVKVASKMPVWHVEKLPTTSTAILDEQFERLQDDHIDFYLLHGLDARTWKRCWTRQLSSAERASADGRIRHLGFSLPRPLRGLRDRSSRRTTAGEFVPDPVQLHGRGVPGRPQGTGSWRPPRASASS